MLMVELLLHSKTDFNVLENRFLKVFSSMRDNRTLINEYCQPVGTRSTKVKHNIVKMKFSILKTNNQGNPKPQAPHIDYQWKCFKDDNNSNNKLIKPAIALWPIDDTGMIVNVWLDDRSPHSKIDKKDDDTYSIMTPYKLILRKGEFALLDGDIIHAGGIQPSGIRGHAYIGYTKSVENPMNSIYDENDLQFSTYCSLPFTDYCTYKINIKKDKIEGGKYCKTNTTDKKIEYNNKVDTTGKFSNQDIKRLISIYTKNAKNCVETDVGKCDVLNLSNIECPIDCGPNCTNNVVRNCKWLRTYVSRFHSEHGYGLFASEKIEKDTFIIEYTGEIQTTNQKKK